MTIRELNSRRARVLEYIVTAYIELGMPIGSVTVCNRFGLDLSPATIRNIMRELEDSGYISQPHTSAGRVPTDAGYRYYVDRIMEPDIITEDEQEKVSFACEAASGEPETLLESASRVLSEISNEVSIVIFARPGKDMPRQARFVSFGWHHLFQQPEFRDAARSGRLMRALEERNDLLRFIEENLNDEGVKVSIGRENSCEGITDCSMIMSGYGAGEDMLGAVGVIGPTRMPYRRIVPIVNYISDRISTVLEGRD